VVLREWIGLSRKSPALIATLTGERQVVKEKEFVVCMAVAVAEAIPGSALVMASDIQA
jgi:hypothetical protein